ncbi:MAG: T9SS type A sorting domain-containing protein [Bacteroidota bacterium]
MYMVNEPISNPNASYVIGPLNYSTVYFFVIDNKYATINIGDWVETPDEHLRFRDTTFSLDPSNKVFTLGTQAAWNAKNVTVKNNFSGGKFDIDDTTHYTVSSSGITRSFGSPTFPHTIKAYDNQTPSDNYKRIFQNWTTPSEPDINLLVEVDAPSSSSATYTANFAREFNINFENKFVGLSNSGTMEINSSTVSLPHSAYPVKETFNIQAEALYQVINGIEYVFSYWTDGTSNWYTASQTFAPNDHKTYKAYFVGKPTNSGKNVQITSSVGQPITLTWTDINNNYVSYKIYRKVKHDGVSGPEELLASVNKGVETYTDYEYVKTASYVDLVHYDVRGYYSVEQTYSDQNWIAVYGESYIRMQQDNNNMFVGLANELPIEYSISNYPNPFNPTTTIKYQLAEAGMVTLKVYDILGKEVAELINEPKEAGYYEVNFDAKNLTSGVYIYTIRSGKYVESKKMILAK